MARVMSVGTIREILPKTIWDHYSSEIDQVAWVSQNQAGDEIKVRLKNGKVEAWEFPGFRIGQKWKRNHQRDKWNR